MSKMQNSHSQRKVTMFKYSSVKKHPSSWGQVETSSHSEGRKQFFWQHDPGQKGPELGTGVKTRKGTTCFLSWGRTLHQHTALFTDHLPVLHLWHRRVRVAFRLRFAHFQAVRYQASYFTSLSFSVSSYRMVKSEILAS